MPPRVLIACEHSGITREAFNKKGINTYSCDLLPSILPGKHIQCDVSLLLKYNWDLMIAYPPCTYLALSGSRWNIQRRELQREAVNFFLELLYAKIPRVCIENPVGFMSNIEPPSQIIQPYQFGHIESKRTCLWLKGLPTLKPTHIISKQLAKPLVHYMPPSKDRNLKRSITYTGIAHAMADQWSELL